MRAAAALAIAATGCASVPSADRGGLQPIAVAQVLKRHHELDGLVIQVRGVIPYCKAMGCPLRDIGDPTQSLGIGMSARFAGRARMTLGRPVVVQGRLDASCLHSRLDGPETMKNMVICLDRAQALLDPKMIAVQ
jgi:hypothetical protein